MDQEEISGVMEEEVINDGEIELRANQADMKYHALAKSTQFTEEEAKGIHGMDDSDSENEKKVGEAEDEDSGDEGEVSDYGFQFKPSFLLHTDDDTSQKKHLPGQRKKETPILGTTHSVRAQEFAERDAPIPRTNHAAPGYDIGSILPPFEKRHWQDT